MNSITPADPPTSIALATALPTGLTDIDGIRTSDDGRAATPAAQHLIDSGHIEVVTGTGQGVTQLGLKARPLLPAAPACPAPR